jgi:hypothetical protein
VSAPKISEWKKSGTVSVRVYEDTGSNASAIFHIPPRPAEYDRPGETPPGEKERYRWYVFGRDGMRKSGSGYGDVSSLEEAELLADDALSTAWAMEPAKAQVAAPVVVEAAGVVKGSDEEVASRREAASGRPAAPTADALELARLRGRIEGLAAGLRIGRLGSEVGTASDEDVVRALAEVGRG